MSKYAITFSKEGYIKYTSHLDMLRLFKRSIKKSGIKLSYSQGYNPHPKMGFAQPLSLGYESTSEILEIETMQPLEENHIKDVLQREMPKGIKIISCEEIGDQRSIASLVKEATYLVDFPLLTKEKDYSLIVSNYLAEKSILAFKRQKKTKKLVEVDIRNKIRDIKVMGEEYLTLQLRVDCGSNSNLSPEQVINSFIEFAKLPCERFDVNVKRIEIKWK